MLARQADAYDKRGIFPRPRPSAAVHHLPRRQGEDLAGLEFGDRGRDPRFLPGWWILPGLLLSTFMVGIAARLV